MSDQKRSEEPLEILFRDLALDLRDWPFIPTIDLAFKVSGTKKACPSYEEIRMRNRYCDILEKKEEIEKEPDPKRRAELRDEIIQLENVDRIEMAFESGYVSLKDLSYILADEEQSKVELMRHWKEILSQVSPCPTSNSVHERFIAWSIMLERTRQRTAQGDSPLPLYEKKGEGESAKYVECDYNSMRDASLVKLTDIEEYSHSHNLPLPESLFPNQNRTAQTKKRFSKAQLRKNSVRQAARKLWEQDPSITIADMIFRDEINSLLEDKTFDQKYLRSWMQDLCPNHAPGRRAKKK